jgi:hypothetical protein
MTYKIILSKLTPYSVVLRIIIPFGVFFYPFPTAVLMVLLDWVDGVFFRQTKFSNRQYNNFDKALDFYWYAVSLIYAVNNLSYKSLLVLFFAIRTMGQLLFFWLKNDKVFILFPNIYENLFIFLAFVKDFPSYTYLLDTTFFWKIFLVLAIAKLIQEVYAHLYSYKVNKKIPEWMRIPGVD